MDRTHVLIKYNYRDSSGITLIELLIAICIFALIVVGFFHIDTFSRYQVTAAERKTQLQNEASYVLEHMERGVSRAIGDIDNLPDVITIAGDNAVRAWIDDDSSGRLEAASDKEIAYRYSTANYQIWYCPECEDSACAACLPDDWNSANFIANGYVLAKKVSAFTCTYDDTTGDSDPIDNYIEVELTTCWDPDGDPDACGTTDNPSVSVKSRIYMPRVSTN